MPADDHKQPVVKVTFDGETYELDVLTITALEARDFRFSVGVTFGSVVAKCIERQPLEIDELAAVIWLARRRVHRGLTFDEVASGVTFADLLNQLG